MFRFVQECESAGPGPGWHPITFYRLQAPRGGAYGLCATTITVSKRKEKKRSKEQSIPSKAPVERVRRYIPTSLLGGNLGALVRLVRLVIVLVRVRYQRTDGTNVGRFRLSLKLNAHAWISISGLGHAHVRLVRLVVCSSIGPCVRARRPLGPSIV